MDVRGEIDSASAVVDLRPLLVRILFFGAVFAGFLMLGMATAYADDSSAADERPGDSAHGSSASEPLSDLAAIADSKGPKPGAKAKSGSTSQKSHKPKGPGAAKSDAGNAGTSRERSDSTDRPDGPAEEPQADAAEETAENVDDLVADKPTKVVHTVKKTVDNTVNNLTGPRQDTALKDAVEGATKPLVREVSALVDDTHRFIDRETDVARRSVEDLSDSLGGATPGDSPAPGDETPGHQSPDGETPGGEIPGQALPDGSVVKSDAGQIETVPDQSAEVRHVTSSEGTPSESSAGAPSAAPHAKSAALKQLDMSPVTGSAAASAGSTSGGSVVASAAALGAHEFFLSSGAGHQVVAPAAVTIPRTVNRQPGFVPD